MPSDFRKGWDCFYYQESTYVFEKLHKTQNQDFFYECMLSYCTVPCKVLSIKRDEILKCYLTPTDGCTDGREI